jgi:hypothetical protein
MCPACCVDNSWGFAAHKHSRRITADHSSLIVGLFGKNIARCELQVNDVVMACHPGVWLDASYKYEVILG